MEQRFDSNFDPNWDASFLQNWQSPAGMSVGTRSYTPLSSDQAPAPAQGPVHRETGGVSVRQALREDAKKALIGYRKKRNIPLDQPLVEAGEGPGGSGIPQGWHQPNPLLPPQPIPQDVQHARRQSVRPQSPPQYQQPQTRAVRETTTSAAMPASLPQQNLGPTSTPPGDLKQSIAELERAIRQVHRQLSLARRYIDREEIAKLQKLLAVLSEHMLRDPKETMERAYRRVGLFESRFIGASFPESGVPLSFNNDTGAKFRDLIGEDNEVVDQVANQLSSGMPIPLVSANVRATLGTTNNPNYRATLNKALHVLCSL